MSAAEAEREPVWVVLAGGDGAEREVSLASGEALTAALRESFAEVRLEVLGESALPDFLQGQEHVVFPIVHGTYGEDGGMQRDLEARGLAYVGCDAVASALCMDKEATKRVAQSCGVPVAEGWAGMGRDLGSWSEVVAALGEGVIVKPVDEGSSVGMCLLRSEGAWREWQEAHGDREFLVERYFEGVDHTVGVLAGKAMGIVASLPQAEVYDYQSKYTAGSCEYVFPAALSAAVTAQVQAYAEAVFAACACRDFARIDFMVQEEERVCFLEVNTLPGLTSSSLLPKSAACEGLSFVDLCRRMALPAWQRWREAEMGGAHG